MDNSRTSNSSTEAHCHFSFTTGVALLTLTAIVSVLGSCGNIIVLLIPYFCPRLRNRPSSFLILNLSVADLVVTAIACPLNGVYLLTKAEGKCALGNDPLSLLTARRVVITFSSSASLLILTLVSLERLCVISWPLRHRTTISTKRLFIASIIIWMSAITYGTLAAFKTFHRPVRSFAVAGTVFFYVIITVCYVRIFFLTARQRTIRDGLNAHVGRPQVRAAAENQVAKTMAIVIGVFTLCLVPFTVLRSLLSSHEYGLLYDSLLLLALSHSAANPLIYFYRSKDFRSVLKRIVLWCRCCVLSQTSADP